MNMNIIQYSGHNADIGLANGGVRYAWDHYVLIG